MKVVDVALAIAAAALLPGGTFGCDINNICFDDAIGLELQFPDKEISSGGSLTTTLTVEPAVVKFDFLEWTTRTFNGGVPGPTIMIRPGDDLTITVRNTLPANPDGGVPYEDKAEMRLPNSVNLHTHGLHVSGVAPADDVLNVQIHPGYEFTYEYNILQSQTPGSFWYHPHYKGPATLQTSGGMAGAIIVLDDLASMAPDLQPLKDISCDGTACEHDLVLVLQHLLNWASNEERTDKPTTQDRTGPDQYMLDDATTDILHDASNGVNYFTVNGQLKPFHALTGHQATRLRLIYADGYLPLDLEIVNDDPTSPNTCSMWLIAMDGVYLAKPETRTFVVLSSASRADVVIRCEHAGEYWLRSTSRPENERSMGLEAGSSERRYDGDLLRFVVSEGSSSLSTGWNAGGAALSMDLTQLLPEGVYPDLMSINRDCDASQNEIGPDCIWGRYNIEFASNRMFNREKLSSMPNVPPPPTGGQSPLAVAEEGEKRTRYRMPKEAVVEFSLTNADPSDAHVLHIHINHFVVVSYDPYTGPVGQKDPQGLGQTHLEYLSQNGDSCDVQYDESRTDPIVNLNTRAPIETYTPDLTFLGHENEIHVTDDAENAEDNNGYVALGQWRDSILVPPLVNMKIRYYAHELTGPALAHCHLSMHADTGMAMVMAITEDYQCARPDANSNQFRSGTCMNGDPTFPTGWEGAGSTGTAEDGPLDGCDAGVYTPPATPPPPPEVPSEEESEGDLVYQGQDCGGSNRRPCRECRDWYCADVPRRERSDCVENTVPDEWKTQACLDSQS